MIIGILAWVFLIILFFCLENPSHILLIIILAPAVLLAFGLLYELIGGIWRSIPSVKRRKQMEDEAMEDQWRWTLVEWEKEHKTRHPDRDFEL